KGFLDVGAAFVADAQSPVLVQPRKAALDDPVLASERGRVRALWPGDLRLDVTATQFAAALPRVVSAVAEQPARADGGHGLGPPLRHVQEAALAGLDGAAVCVEEGNVEAVPHRLVRPCVRVTVGPA